MAYPLVFCWPIAIALISAIYCCKHSTSTTLPFYKYSFPALTLRTLARRRSELKQLLSSDSDIDSGCYFRLMGLAGVELLLGVPLASYFLYLNINSGIFPWRGWSDTHFYFSRVDQYSSPIWKSSPINLAACELSRWSVVVCAFIFFAFFGFTDEARKNYRIAFSAVARKVGYTIDLGSARHEAPGIIEFARRPSRLHPSKDYIRTQFPHSVLVIEPHTPVDLFPEPLPHNSDVSISSATLPSRPEPIFNLSLNRCHSANVLAPARPDVMSVAGRQGENMRGIRLQNNVGIDNSDTILHDSLTIHVCPSWQ
jgi:hypothetical protein